MSRGRRMVRQLLGGIIVVLMAASGKASAQATAPFYLKGSDTLFDIATQSINKKVSKDQACTAAGTCPAGMGILPPNTLVYDGTGSGNGEGEMKSAVGGGAKLGIQSIAPMSRNFRPAVVTQFPSWAPTVQNVLGLDAAVIVEKSVANRCKNLSLSQTVDAAGSPKANPNNTALKFHCSVTTATLCLSNADCPSGETCGFGTTGAGYDQVLQVMLSGVDGSGSTAACADPRRVQAVADFAACNGIPAINHFYRRDDNSGTTDTFKDKINVGRFCNGAGIGVLGTNKAHPNLNNQDLDPIRRPCDVSTASRLQVACTDLTTGLACNSTAATCTQGLVTALSENDPAFTDITLTIANRAANDPTGATAGYAGRASVELASSGTAPALINTNPPSNALVRLDAYMLSRRLWLQRGPSNPLLDASVDFNSTSTPPPPSSGPPAGCTGSACGNQRVNDNAGPSATLTCPDGSTTACTGGSTTQRNFEDVLFNYMTDPGGSASPDGAPGRCNTDPLMVQYGFLTCLDDCLATPSGVSNLCSKTPYLNLAAPPSACVPTSGQWQYQAVACTSATQICCSTGLACGTGLSCPAANSGRIQNSACSQAGVQAECATGLTCTDIGGGTLVCQ